MSNTPYDEAVSAYAWEIQGGPKGEYVLCRWAAPSRAQLEAQGKPSDEARVVSVRIVRRGAWRNINKLAGGKF